jgi:hypothetical protein
MPTLKFTHPTTGQTISVNSPDGSTPSEVELDQMFNQVRISGGIKAAKAETGEIEDKGSFKGFIGKQSKAALDELVGIPETVAGVVTGAVAQPVSYLGGAVMGALKGGEEGKKFREYLADTYTYKPQTQSGKKAMEAVNLLTAPLGLPRKAGEYVGGKIDTATGNKTKDWEEGLGNVAEAPLQALGLKGAMGALEKRGIISQNTNLSGYTTPEGFSTSKPSGIYDKLINDVVKKGFSGTTGFKAKTAGDFTKEISNKTDAVKSIIENKGDLKLSDGTPLPKTVYGLTEAIEQTKNNIWNKEIAPAILATDEAGFKIIPEKTFSALDDILNDKTLLGSRGKKIKAEATTLKTQLEEISQDGGFTAKEAQKFISETNKESKSFFNKVNPELDTELFMRLNIANDLRAGLDNAALKATGEGIQGSKNKYGNLLSIEESMNTLRNKQFKKELGANNASYWEIGTDWGLLHGVLSMNAPAFFSTLGAKALVAYRKYTLNPNRYVSNMFNVVDKAVSKQDKGFTEAFKGGLPKKEKPQND